MRWALPILLLLFAGVFAQDVKPEDPNPLLEEAKKRLEELGKEETEQSKVWRSAIERRVSVLQDHVNTLDEAKALGPQEEVAARKSEAEREREQARRLKPPEAIRLESAKESERYEERYNKARTERDSKQSALDGLNKKHKTAREEQQNLPSRDAEARRKLVELKAEDELTKYRAKTLNLEIAFLAVRAKYLKEGRDRQSALIPVLEIELDAAKLRFEYNRKVYELAREEAARLREAEAKRAEARAKAERKAAERERDPIERFKRTAAADATAVSADAKTLKSVIEALDVQKTERTSGINMLREEREHLELRLERRSEASSDLLRRMVNRYSRQLQILKDVTNPKLREDSAAHQKDLVSSLDRLWDLQLPEEANREYQALLESVPAARHEEARSAFVEATEGKNGLIPTLRTKVRALEKIDARHSELSLLNGEYETELELLEEYILLRILWIRSDPPLETDLGEAGEELASLWQRWTDGPTWSAIGNIRSAILVCCVLAVALAFYLSTRIHRRIVKRAQSADAGRSVGRTLLALVVALIPPVVLVMFALVLKTLALPDVLEDPFFLLLDLLALFLLIQRVSTWLLNAGGVAVQFWGQPVAVTTQVLRSIRIITIAGMCCYAPAVVLAKEPIDLARVPWLLETLWVAAVAVALYLLVGRKSALIQQLTGPGSLLRKLIVVLSFFLRLGLLGVVLMHVFGYRVGARHLLLNTGRTIAAIVILIGFYSLAVMVVRRIASGVRARKQEEEGAAAAWASSSAVAQELTRLVAFVLSIVAFIALINFWGFGGLLIKTLESVQLVSTGEGWLTLWDIVVALLWICGGHALVHNLAAFYESVVFPLFGGGADRGARFVFLAVSRYVILLVAYAAAILTLGFSFASLGWLVAAFSVGVGFGLQEIIANFVSGLILLFERPVRVGDTITVGQTGGTVEKINIRATTVTNWDRQSIVIPNRNFITQNVTNWTLSDNVVRRVVKVGVAYGSDVEKVLKVLDEVATEQKFVLKDPPHRIWLESFGDCALNFDVWVYTQMEHGFRTMTDVRKAIYERFTAEGIEIPLPKRDLQILPAPEGAGPEDPFEVPPDKE
ncbi:MAG: mechanosensitive ion channel domain-containing protein, partial [Planctomycetota bacterium]